MPEQIVRSDKRTLRFVATGFVGFGVELLVLTLLTTKTGVGPIWARSVSFPLAVLATWLVNRSWTFADRPQPSPLHELVKYSSVQVLGFAVNVGVYLALVSQGKGIFGEPVVALTICGMSSALITYALLYFKVFPDSSRSTE